VDRYGKPDASMTGTACWAGLVAITAPSGCRESGGLRHHRLIAGALVCLAVEFFDRVAKVETRSAPSRCMASTGFGESSLLGLFADGTSNYGGAWNGVSAR